MIQSTIEIDIKRGEEVGKLTVRLQEISPLRMSDLITDSANDQGRCKPGLLIENALKNGVIISPKNLVEQIEENEDGLGMINDLYPEIMRFCGSPKQYEFRKKQRESKEKSADVGDNI